MPSGRSPLSDRTADAGRAGAIIRGLLRSGRARPRLLSETGDDATEFIRLDRHAAHGASYWGARRPPHAPTDGERPRRLSDMKPIASGDASPVRSAKGTQKRPSFLARNYSDWRFAQDANELDSD
jgi:hypothetical protein